MIEEWDVFPNNPSYSISNFGRVINNKWGTELRKSIDNLGYSKVTMYENATYRSYYVHRVVASLFLEDFTPDRIIEFIDRDKQNCSVRNLQIRESSRDRIKRIRETRPRINARRVRIVELDKVFSTAIAAANYIGGDSGAVYRCLRGERYSHLGYTFETVDTKQALSLLRGGYERY